jgi:hypothetical protein
MVDENPRSSNVRNLMLIKNILSDIGGTDVLKGDGAFCSTDLLPGGTLAGGCRASWAFDSYIRNRRRKMTVKCGDHDTVFVRFGFYENKDGRSEMDMPGTSWNKKKGGLKLPK